MESTAPLPEPQAVEPQPPAMSLGAKLLNVIASPAEVFAQVKVSSNQTANWLVPVLVYAVVGVISVCVLFTQPAIRQTVRDQQAKALDQQVQKGKITQAQEDQILQAMDRFMGPTVMAVFGSVSIIIYSFVSVFWWALVLWLLARWCSPRGVTSNVVQINGSGLTPRGEPEEAASVVVQTGGSAITPQGQPRIGYLKMMEVAGLTSVILVLAMIIGTLLAVILGRLNAGPSLALLVSDFDPTNRFHLMLGAANVLYFWHTAVLGIGLATVSGASTAKSVLLVFAYWLLAELLLIAAGLGPWTL